MNNKKLYKSRDKKISGVCGGVAEYIGIDPAIVRIIWALVAFFTGFGFIAYLIAAVVLDENPYGVSEDGKFYDSTYQEIQNEPESDEIKGFKP